MPYCIVGCCEISKHSACLLLCHETVLDFVFHLVDLVYDQPSSSETRLLVWEQKFESRVGTRMYESLQNLQRDAKHGDRTIAFGIFQTRYFPYSLFWSGGQRGKTIASRPQRFTLKLFWFHFDRNIVTVGLFLQITYFFSVYNCKKVVFGLCLVTLFAEVKLRFDLVPKCRSAIAEFLCASTKSKSLLRKLCCALEIKLRI